ncbi:hypothetical protein QR77_41645 [Streptomyces sp. 150FB]|uniref:hypothetical protein n=1 Tax=Streptomyces sp. 150FB TaxID=1576605 RepID=UPI00058952B4|nr:hypothetical protein [Streptomyces sp. 150FB]KIF72777.1 hypothetical protein QR77_41645 [Streptomyces sp. 150FB]
MYLVHLTLAPSGDAHPPAEIKQALHDAAPDVVDHVTVHTQTRPHLVVSLFLRAASLDEAEAAAKRIWQHATTRCSPLAAWSLRRAEVPLHPYDME